MNIIEEIEQRQSHKADAAFEIYRKAVFAEARGEPAKAGHLQKLADAMALLAKSTADLQADVSIVRQAIAAEALAAELPPRRAAWSEAEKCLAEFDEATAKLLQEREAQRLPLLTQLQAGEQAHAKAESASQKLNRLRAEHWKLLDMANPAENAKRRHLVIQSRTKPLPESDCLYINAASVFADPKAHRLDYEFVVAPGQTAKELAELLNVYRKWNSGHIPQPAFLNASGESDVSVNARLVIDFRQVKREIAQAEGIPWFNPHDFYFVCEPGQTPEQLAAMVDELTKLYESRPAVKNAKKRKAFFDSPRNPGERVRMTTLESTDAQLNRRAEQAVRA